MRSLWLWIVILFSVASLSAQTVNLAGIVTDSASNSPLSGVIVVLVTLRYWDSTTSDGKYSLTNSSPLSIIASKTLGTNGTHPSINNGFLFFNLSQKEKVTAVMYSPTGRSMGTIIDQELAPGTYRAALPSIQKSAGIYYIKVISGNSQEIVKFLSLNGQQGQNRSMKQSGGLDKKLATVVDTLLFEKTGYVTKNIPITSYEGTLNITMTAMPTDIDGNVYHTVTIGPQVWMVENLKTTRYNDGSAIPLDTNSNTWGGLTTGAYCWYNDSATYGSKYGALYNWYAVSTGKLAPTGWHVPSDSEWEALGTYLGDDTVAGGPLKETGTTHWNSPNTGATNATGFSALPGGVRTNYGAFGNIGTGGSWWSSTAGGATSSWNRNMNYNLADVCRSDVYNADGFSVRCVRDN